MEIQVFIEKFAEVLDVDSSSLTPETEFADLDEWNSMAVVQVVVMIDEEFGQSVTPVDIRKCVTLADIFNLL